MTHEESFILRWIEWNEINPPLIEYVWGLVTADKGSPQFRNVMGGVFGAMISPVDGAAQFSYMPSIDDLATRYETVVEVIPEADLLAAGEAKLTYCIAVLENAVENPWYGPPNGMHPRELFSNMSPIAKVPSSTTDFLRLSLLAAGLPTDVNVEEVRYTPSRVLVKTFRILDVVTNQRNSDGALVKDNVIKFYALVPGAQPEEIEGWD